jgi:uncharacterized protein GlcG (DUF336 family)
MITRTLMIATIVVFSGLAPASAKEALVTHKTLSLDAALKLASAALADCQKRGYQVAVAVVDGFGGTQVVLRDRFAGPFMPTAATDKARTAVNFRANTTEIVRATQPGMPQAGVRYLPGVVTVGGGLIVEANGSLVGAIGVSGAPTGDANDACAKAGISKIQDEINF